MQSLKSTNVLTEIAGRGSMHQQCKQEKYLRLHLSVWFLFLFLCLRLMNLKHTEESSLIDTYDQQQRCWTWTTMRTRNVFLILSPFAIHLRRDEPHLRTFFTGSYYVITRGYSSRGSLWSQQYISNGSGNQTTLKRLFSLRSDIRTSFFRASTIEGENGSRAMDYLTLHRYTRLKAKQFVTYYGNRNKCERNVDIHILWDIFSILNLKNYDLLRLFFLLFELWQIIFSH